MNTQVERKSRRLFARLVDDKSASATARAEYEIFKGLPPAARIDRTVHHGRLIRFEGGPYRSEHALMTR